MSLTHVSEIVPRSNILGAPDQSLPSEPLFARYLNTPSPPTVHLPAETRFRHRRITSSQSAAEPRPRGPCAYRDSRCESRSPSKWGLLLTASRHHKHIKSGGLKVSCARVTPPYAIRHSVSPTPKSAQASCSTHQHTVHYEPAKNKTHIKDNGDSQCWTQAQGDHSWLRQLVGGCTSSLEKMGLWTAAEIKS